LTTAGPLGHALLNNQGIHIPDTANSQRYAPDPRWPEVRSRVILPVRVGGRILGVLDLHSHNRVVRNQAELDALQTLADELGAAMRNAQLYAQALQARTAAVQAGLLRSRLLANISHQLRSPLNVILGYSQAALATPNPYDVALPPELLQDLSYIERSGADLERLINDLLDLALAETGALRLYPELVELRDLLANVFEAAERTFGENTDVRWRLQMPSQLPTIHADPVRLRNVLMNLLNNAARFTTSGQITLGAECADVDVHLWVQDTGCGMAAETLARIRQHRLAGDGTMLNPQENSTGLGLTIAQHLVHLHSGELIIESELGRGTTCHFYLPRQHATHVAVPGTKSTQANGAQLRRDVQSHQFVEKIRQFIAENYATPLTREQIATWLGVTPTYLSRIFRQQSGHCALGARERLSRGACVRAAGTQRPHGDGGGVHGGLQRPCLLQPRLSQSRRANRLRYIAPRPDSSWSLAYILFLIVQVVLSNCARQRHAQFPYTADHTQSSKKTFVMSDSVSPCPDESNRVIVARTRSCNPSTLRAESWRNAGALSQWSGRPR
jgi:signal transduction histidine kinase/AraC-like DNA-binding protein